MSIRSRIIVLALAVAVLATTAMAVDMTAFSVGIAANESLATNETSGMYLTNETGFSLYYFQNDASVSGSACNQECAAIWPPFYAENITVPLELNASDFSTIARDDGSPQTTYRGWPLYLYAEDKMPGDILGQGVNSIWFLVEPDGIEPRSA
ncbi:MAG: hypothetical protein GKC10_01205 [Methanosarcinales archaeon]|nr:hypothetical protein [Methanosarcinales archaeon]